MTRYNRFDLQGSGRVENLGLWELFKDSIADIGNESIVRLPVNVPAGGRLLLSTNALVVFTQPSSLTVGGELEAQEGARLRLDGSTPTRDVTLLAGSVLGGTGTVLLEGANRVVLAGNVTWGIGLLDMTGSSTITGAFSLTVSTGSILRYNHSSTIPGSVTVNGTLQLTSSSVTLVINGLLTLNASGTLNNPGTIQVGIGEFLNNGGTIIGNPPQQIGGTSTAPQISGIQLNGPPQVSLQKAQATLPPREVLITWSGRTRQDFVIETSTDLGRWKEASATITEIAPGAYQGRLAMPVEAQQFFRVRLVPRDPSERTLDRPYHPL